PNSKHRYRLSVTITSRYCKMVRAWYMDDSNADQRETHMLDPPVFVSLDELFEKCGVEYKKFNADTWETNVEFAELRKKRGYTYEDLCEISRETLPDYDNKLKNFYTEHIHSDEEIRFVLEGCGYFDVRDSDDRWIRVEVSKDDLIIVPAGIYHRFSLNTDNYIKVKRLFVGEPVWTPINRPGADDHPVRQEYLKRMQSC
ncbi:1,2-dihydroxy-3-keto-5-methylthiopentene dioxygenase isoform X1, partial [Biomphalaria glabrata]